MLLQKGDVIRLEKGMKVYTKIPAMFAYDTKPFMTEPVCSLITVGDVYTTHRPSKEILSKLIGKSICRYGIEIESSKVQEILESLNLNYENEQYDTSKYVGEYIVVETSRENGSVNTCDSTDFCMKGHKVSCQKLDDEEIKIEFYQNGILVNTIRDIVPLNR